MNPLKVFTLAIIVSLAFTQGTFAQEESPGVISRLLLNDEERVALYNLAKETFEKETGETGTRSNVDPIMRYIRITRPVLGYAAGSVFASYRYQFVTQDRKFYAYRFIVDSKGRDLGLFGGAKEDPFPAASIEIPQPYFNSYRCWSDKAPEGSESLKISVLYDWNTLERYASVSGIVGACDTDLNTGIIRCSGQDGQKSFEFAFDTQSKIQVGYSALCVLLGGTGCAETYRNLDVTIRTEGLIISKVKTYTYQCDTGINYYNH